MHAIDIPNDYLLVVACAWMLGAYFHLLGTLIEGLRMRGWAIVIPELYPFRSLPVLECCILGVHVYELVIWENDLGSTFDTLVIALVLVYTWLESSLDVVGVFALLFATPGALDYSLVVWQIFLIALLLQPQVKISDELWYFSSLLILTTLSRKLTFFSSPTQPWPFLLCALAIEVSAYSFRRRVFGYNPEYTASVPLWWATIVRRVTGIRIVSVDSWLGNNNDVPSALPPAVRGVVWYGGENVVQARRLHTARKIDDFTYAVPVAEWDEIAFSATGVGFLYAVLSSLRLPSSIRIKMNADKQTIASVFLVVLFLKCTNGISESILGPLHPRHALVTTQTDDRVPTPTCVLIPTRLTLRRVMELLFVAIFLSHT
jgi:hypothetical protein